MRHHSSWLAVWGMFVMVGCQEAPQVVELPPPEVTISQPEVRTVVEHSDFTGLTKAVKSVEVRAQVSGELKDVIFTDGEEVKENDVLFEIDPRPFQAQLDQAKAEISRWEAAVVKSTADLERTKKLRETYAKTQEDLDLAIAQEKSSTAEKLRAEALAREAELNLEFATIKAPISGKVGKAEVTKGNLISAPANVVLTTIRKIDQMYVEFDVDENTLLRYREQTKKEHPERISKHIREWKIPVQIGLGNETGYPHEGMLDFAENTVDPDTGTIRVRGLFENEDRSLTPGLFVRVRLPFGEPHKAVLITPRAIGSDQGKKFVLVVNDKNVAEYREVTLGPEDNGQRIVLKGLSAEDWVIVNGIQRVRPGKTVTPHKLSEAEKAKPKTETPATDR